MQDRHLYRGRRLDNGEWVTGYVFINVKSTSIGVCSPTQRGAVRWFKCDPATVGQCTGLRDKTGKLVFEGDILKIDKAGRCVVEYGNRYCKCGFVVRYNDGVAWDDIDNINNYSAKEVIGTIHTTPELMEVEA